MTLISAESHKGVPVYTLQEANSLISTAHSLPAARFHLRHFDDGFKHQKHCLCPAVCTCAKYTRNSFFPRLGQISHNNNKCRLKVPAVHKDVFKCLMLCDQQSKTQKHSVCKDVKTRKAAKSHVQEVEIMQRTAKWV